MARQRLFVAQQALSSQIRQLEGRLGVELFERTTRRVGLTEAGELLLPHAVAALAALDAGAAQLDAAVRAQRATLRVGLSGTAMVQVAHETMRRFAERHPEVELQLSNTGLSQPAAGLGEGPSTWRSCARRSSTRGSPWSRCSPRSATRSCARTIRLPPVPSSGPRTSSTSRGSGSREAIRGRARSGPSQAFRGERPLQTGTRVNSFEEAFGAVAAGLAITCQAESAVLALGSGFPELRFVPLRGTPPAQVAVAWRTAHETELARAFVRTALEVSQPRDD